MAERDDLVSKIRSVRVWEDELEHIEALLKSRFQWSPDRSVATPPIVKESPPERPRDLVIDYAQEARLWMEGHKGVVCTTVDFLNHLKRKFGPDAAINRNSIGSPFRQMVSAGILEVEVEGKGKRATLYRITRRPTTNNDEEFTV